MWDFYAEHYYWMRSNPISQYILSLEIRSLSSLLEHRSSIPRYGKALDMGTGVGTALKIIPSEFAMKFAIDSSLSMVQITKARYPEVIVTHQDAMQTQFDDSTFDLILCIGLSEYVAGIESLIDEINRLLKEQGYCIFTSALPRGLNRIRHFLGHRLFFRTDSELQSILASRFKIVRRNQTLLQGQYLLEKLTGLPPVL